MPEIQKPFIFLLFFSLCFGFNLPLIAQNVTDYQRVYLSGKDNSKPINWDFKVSDGRLSGEWTTIQVPSNWEMEGFGTINYGHDHKNSEIKLGDETGAYRYEFELPKEYRGKVIHLVFEGAMTDTEVKVNGKSAGGIHQGGFQQFKYDVSDLIKPGRENLLEVNVSKRSKNESINKAEREADFWIFGGIYRPVYLEILPKIHFSRVAVDPKGDGTLRSLLTLNQIPKSGNILVEVKELGSLKVLDAFTQEIDNDSIWVDRKISGIKAWSPETPHLYEVKFSISENDKILYSKTERIGFRTVELRPKDGFYINGEKTIFKGVNRHSFHPKTGRSLSEENHLEDILLMKEMNMNAVRMSHYQPDERFLELCDSLGLYVLDEVTGWQDGYDTIVGPRLVKEAVLKDANHPSVVAWNHGNEGGWSFPNEKGFHEYDIQDRPVLYPWLLKNNVDTHHYPRYKAGIQRLSNGGDIFMPTELLHGLYDGGLGAGLDDFWKDYTDNPLGAGGFLWVFADAALYREDKGGKLDSDGNHAPDGILGPYKEKEGSFYTIKEIWSPIQVLPFSLTPLFDGKIRVKNDYQFANLDQSRIELTIFKLNGWESPSILHKKEISLPSAEPGETRGIQLDLPDGWQGGDHFTLKAIGINGEELYTWSYPIRNAKEQKDQTFESYKRIVDKPLELLETEDELRILAGDRKFVFDMDLFALKEIWQGEKNIPISQLENQMEGLESKKVGASFERNPNGSVSVTFNYEPYPKSVVWTIFADGRLKMEASSLAAWLRDVDLLGIGFSIPENQLKSIRWIGNGPYRVWQNRLKGVEFGVWEKEYNNTQTGYSFESLVYPEFKGYHSNLHALKLQMNTADIIIRSETPNLYFSLLHPEYPEESTPGVKPSLPKSNLAFLYKIPGIGTKFHLAEEMGPQSQKGNSVSRKEDEGSPIVLWFDFK